MSKTGSVDLLFNLKGQPQAVAGVNRVGQAVKENSAGINAALRSTNASFGAVEDSIGKVAKAAAALYIFNQVKQGIEATVNASLGLQRIQRGLEFATGSAKEGGEAFAFVRVEASRLGLDLRSSATEFTKLAAAAHGTALQGKGAADIFTAISEASTVMGLTAEESGGALNAIQQMISKGTVAAEELRGQLGERLPGAFQMAARSMGVTTQELGKMLQMGQVMADDFLPKFAAELHKSFGESAKEAANQGQAAINKFNSALFDLEATLGTAIMPALIEVTGRISALFAEAEASGKLQEAFKSLGKVAVFTAEHLSGIAQIGKALFAVYSIRKIAAIAVELRNVALAIRLVSLSNPVMAALTLTVGAGVIAYQQAKTAAQNFNDEAKNIKEGEKQLTEYADKVDSLTLKFEKLHGQWADKSPFPNIAPPAGTPANPKAPNAAAIPLSDDQAKTLAQITKETNTARLTAMKEGSDLALALEKEEHTRRVESYKAVPPLLIAEEERYQAKITEIKSKARADRYDATLKDLIKDASIREKQRADETKFLEEENQWRDDLQAQRTDSKIAAMAEGAEKTFAENERITQRERQAFLDSDAFKVASAQDISDILSDIEKSGANRRDKIRKEEADSAKKTMMGQVQYAADMGSLLLSGIDNFYAHSKKNAGLHKILDAGIVEMDGAVAAIKAYAELGPIAGAVAAGFIEFKTQSAMYKINKQKFANSGILQSDSNYGDRVPFMGNAGEMILNSQDQRSLFSLVKSGGQSAPGHTFNITYAPVYPAGAGNYGPAFTEAARKDKVEFGRFLDNELKKKGYAK